MNDTHNFEAKQFEVFLTDYNFVSIEQEIPFRTNKASIKINPDDISEIVEAITTLESSDTEDSLEIGKFLISLDDSALYIYDNEKYKEDEDQFIVLHPDQSELLIKWILNLKKVVIEKLGYDTLKIKTFNNKIEKK